MSTPEPAFLETADAIGRRLCRDALWQGGRCNWLGWSMEPIGNAWTPAWRALSPMLYDGTAGIALFLARLVARTGDPVERETLEGAIRQAVGAASGMEDRLLPGVYAGRAGIAWSALVAGEALERDDLLLWGLESLAALRGVKPSGTDVISGSAGIIPLLLATAGRFNRPGLLEAAAVHGEHLLAQATRTAEGWSWDTTQTPGQRHLLGYAHGAAGIATALLELWRVTGDARFREAAREAIRYESGHFSPEQGNWPDFRTGMGTPSAGPSFLCAWCHGAPGIGLARLRVLRLLGRAPDVLAEVRTAARTTAAALSQPVLPGQGNFSLCHGAAGNADFLLAAAETLDDLSLRQAAEAVGWYGAQTFHRPDLPWPCGVPGAGETPNLFLGLAGIGHFYLRLHDPASVPSVLLLEPDPPRAGAEAGAPALSAAAV